MFPLMAAAMGMPPPPEAMGEFMRNRPEDIINMRYGGPRKKNAKKIARASKVVDKNPKSWLETIPREILYRAMDFLDGADLKNAALVNKYLSEVAIRALFTRSQFVITNETTLEEVKKLKPEHRQFINTVKIVHAWSSIVLDALAELPSIIKVSIVGYEKIKPKNPDPLGYAASSVTDSFAQSISGRLVELRIHNIPLGAVQKLLAPAKDLKKLVIGCVPKDKTTDLAFGQILESSVSEHLDQLHFVLLAGSRKGITDLAESSKISTLGDRQKWPALKRVRYGDCSRDGHRLSWFSPSKDIPSPLPEFHVALYKAFSSHGSWSFEVNNISIIDTMHVDRLETDDLVKLLRWLAPSNEDFVNYNSLDNDYIQELKTPQVDRLATKIHRLSTSTDSKQLRVRLSGTMAPRYPSVVLNALTKRCTELEVRLSEPIPSITNPEDLHEEFLQWEDSLGVMISMAHRMHTFRLASDGIGRGIDLQLSEYDHELTELCAKHQLRHIDIDVSALTQPETHALEELTEQPGAHMANMHLLWMVPPPNFPVTPTHLSNLESLTLRGIFLRQKIEFVWFTKITSQLKALQRLHVDGVVWHAGHDKEADWANDDEWVDSDDEEEEEEELDDGPTSRLGPSRVPPPGPQANAPAQRPYREHTDHPMGTTIEPEDEEDRMMNQMIAQMMLGPEFEAMMRQKMGLTEEQAKADIQYQMMMSSREAMRGELERRATDGTVRLQGNPFGSGMQPRYHGPAHKGEAAKEDDDGEEMGEEDEDNDYNEDAKSTDSEFGVDPRFSELVDEGLREKRLARWIENMLIKRAREVGGTCTEVTVEDVRVDARGLKPWALRTKKDRGMKKSRGEFWGNTGLPL